MNPRQIAIAAIRAKLGLSNTPSDWTYLQREDYNKELANYILANSAQFPPQDREVASNIAAQIVSPLGDSSFVSDLGVFGDAFLNELEKAGEKVADVGNGVLDGVSAVGKLIPFALVAIALFYVIKIKHDLDTSK